MVSLRIQWRGLLPQYLARNKALHARTNLFLASRNRFSRIHYQNRLVETNLNNMYDLSALDSAPEWTLDQIAGLVFGGFLVALYFSSKFIDKYVATSQRRQLGICEKCGGINDQVNCTEKDCPQKAQMKSSSGL